ncbi:MAG: NAD-dependent epimerase/dehydratase family protein, partial [Pseudomonadales bacterium]|nr:NAD-dependent epimerase/dehydratase family protein [Pseudomonadales bacterium]
MQLQQQTGKSALIIGGNGTFGSALGTELLAQGWKVKVLIRDLRRQPKWLISHAEANAVQLCIGDCAKLADVERAAQGMDLLVYAANPSYSQWHKHASRMLEPSALMAEKLQLHILFPGNVYAYDPVSTPVIDECSAFNPPTQKGVIRMEMEQRLQRAASNGATVTLVRCGDFIAKDSASSWMQHLLSAKKSHWNLANPSTDNSTEDHYHSYVWVEDLAKNALALVDYDAKHNRSSYNQWCDPGLFVSHQDW